MVIVPNIFGGEEGCWETPVYYDRHGAAKQKHKSLSIRNRGETTGKFIPPSSVFFADYENHGPIVWGACVQIWEVIKKS